MRKTVGGQVETWEKPQIRVVDDRSRFRRSKQRDGWLFLNVWHNKISGPEQYFVSRFGQSSRLRGRLHPGITSASLSVKPVHSTTTGYSRVGRPSILRSSLTPGTSHASLTRHHTARSWGLRGLGTTASYATRRFFNGLGNSILNVALGY